MALTENSDAAFEQLFVCYTLCYIYRSLFAEKRHKM